MKICKHFFLYFISKIKIRFSNFTNQNIVSGKIGHNTVIQKNTMVDSESIIGDECYINTFCKVTKAIIGNYCAIGSNVVIGPGEHDINELSIAGLLYKENTYNELTSKPCTIGNGVWIGTYVIIKRGVKIGNCAVIGAHSVVTKDVPDFAIVVGVPAKVIRFRFNNEIQKKIIDSNWWNLDLQNAKQLLKKLETECVKR